MSVDADRRLMCCWPIVDVEQTLDELSATAVRDLPEMLYRLKVQAAEPPRWDVIAPEDDERPLLIMSMLVAPWRDPQRTRNRRATTPREVAR